MNERPSETYEEQGAIRGPAHNTLDYEHRLRSLNTLVQSLSTASEWREAFEAERRNNERLQRQRDALLAAAKSVDTEFRRVAPHISVLGRELWAEVEAAIKLCKEGK